jgi:DNA-binding MarR family transcriptional regulator
MIAKLPCYCASLRQAGRAISGRYDAALAGSGLTITHFTLLTTLREQPQARVSDLVEALAMDQTTLSRTLKLMEGEGLIARRSGEDRREVRFMLTRAGRGRLQRAEPHWLAAQEEIRRLLGERAVQQLMDVAFRLAGKLSG